MVDESSVALDIDRFLDEGLVFCDLKAADQTELLTLMCAEAQRRGLVMEGYLEAVLDREKQYPTGLETKVIKVAVPHAMDKSKVIRPAIVVAKLNSPVNFKEMGEGLVDVPAEMVFLLAMTGPKDQLTALQKLVGLFTKDAALIALKEAATPTAIVQAIKDHLDG
ncbi:MAG: PTS sugar transporter subunit IIA [Deltaproteobacteria bacterium]|jgi:PTS system galactitol-specific IIA component|nr:PTS sugar transporter subunit IIA [Deltaproteobacteria bacterium]